MQSWTRYPSLLGSLEAEAAVDLEHYCLLGRTRDFEAAEKVWIERLDRYASLYPFAISHLDNILRQSRYGAASDFLDRIEQRTERAVPDLPQKRVLALLRAYINVFIRGWLRAGLEEVRSIMQWLSTAAQEDYGDFHVCRPRLLDIRVAHLTDTRDRALRARFQFAQNQSTYTTVNDLSFPSGRGEDLNQPWIGYDKWASHLARTGLYWEAINIVKILASTMPPKWSIKTYLSIQDVIGHAQTSTQTMLSQLALCLALSQRYLTVHFHDQATQNLERARVLLAHFEQELQVRCSRQRLELELAKVEQLAPGTHISVSIQQWEHVADIAQRAQD